MIPILFESTYPNTTRTFTGHGIGDLIDATEVIAEENSDDGHEWELTFTYPENGELFSEITLERIVVAKANTYQSPQAFRIYSITKNINHTISVACQHISYDLQNIPVKPITAVGAGPALIAMKSNMLDICNKNNFVFTTNIPTPIPGPSTAEQDDATVKYEEPVNARKVLLDGDSSIHGKYGGDVVVDNYDISLLSIGGSDRGVEINYGVDLVDLDQERNITNMITGILPYYVRAKDTRLDIDLERPSSVTEVGAAMATNAAAYILEAGCKYTLKFTPENTGGTASVNSASGFGSYTFSMDGTEKEYNVIVNSPISVPAGTSLISAVSLPANADMGSIGSLSIVKNYIEPIIYGSITNGPGTYNVPKVAPVDLSEYFQDSNDEPTVAQINAKAAEWVAKEEIGQPEVSLTVSYASEEGKDIHMYDAIRVKFVRIGIDVKSKVTRYKFDVLNERCTEIDVGKTKDSAIFTLQDASKLRKGLLPPDRIARESVTGDKIKRGSVGASQIGNGAISKWNMPNDIIDKDLLGQKSVGVLNLKTDDGNHPAGWHDDPILKSVPDNVYGGYSKKVGYLFDPSMGVPPDNLFGWSYTNPQTGETVFKPLTKWQQNIPYGQLSGVGYVLDPDFILDKDIDASKKLTNGTVTNDQLANTTIDKDKFNTRTRDEWDEIAEKTANFGHLIGPQMAIDVTSDYYAIERLMATAMQAAYYQIDGATGFLMFPQQTGNTAYRVHTIYASDGTTALGYFISNTNITLPPDVSSDIAGLSMQITNLWNVINGYNYGGTHIPGIMDTLADHESRISALES